jgi:hypothetical protein
LKTLIGKKFLKKNIKQKVRGIKMKLIDLLKYIGSDIDIKVLTYDYASEVETELYKGDIFDVPWHIAELTLDNHESEGAIYTDAGTGELLIYVNE